MALTLAINAVGTALTFFNQIEIRTQKALNDLPCRVTEINETQDYNAPQFPIESGEYRGDTIYKLPLKVSARLFVEGYEVEDFENMLNDMQMSADFIEIKSLNGKKYDNLKMLSWARDTTSQMIGAFYYNVSFQKMILVDSLAGLAVVKNGSLSKSKNGGNKQPQEKKKSTLKILGDKFKNFSFGS